MALISSPVRLLLTASFTLSSVSFRIASNMPRSQRTRTWGDVSFSISLNARV